METIIEKINQINTFVRVSSKKEDEALVKFAKEYGYKWYDNSEFKSCYEVYKGDTCYNINKGCYSCKKQLKELNIVYIEFEEIFGKKEG